MAGVIPPLILLAISITSSSRYIEGEDTAHVAGARIVQLACVLLAGLAMVPSRSRLFLYARVIQSIVLTLTWISKAYVYALRSVHTSTSFRAYYTSSPWVYLGVETTFAIALQGPLYESKLLPEWLILTGGLTDAAIISYTATQHTSVSWLRYFSAHWLTTAVMPFAAHTFQKYKLVGARAAAMPSARVAATEDCNCSVSKLQGEDPSSSVKATAPFKHFEDTSDHELKNAETPAGGVLNTSTPFISSTQACEDKLADCSKPHAKPKQGLNPNPDSCNSVTQQKPGTQQNGIPHEQSVQSVPNHGMPRSGKHQEQKGRLSQPRSSQSSLLTSLTQEAAAVGNRLSPPPYQSKLVAMKRTAAIKIRTDTHPSQLPDDMATQLEASLKYICGASYSISSLAVRQGCIMITAEFLTASSSPKKAHKRRSSDPYNIMELAHSMLPNLKSIISQGVKQLLEGEYVRLQVENKVVRCYLDEHEAWQLVEDEGLPKKFENIKLRLARPASLNEQDKVSMSAQTAVNSTATQEVEHEQSTAGNESHSSTGQANKNRAQGIFVDVMVQGMSRIAHASDCAQLVCGWQSRSGKDVSHDDFEWGSFPPSKTATTAATSEIAATTTSQCSNSGSGKVPPLKLLARSGDAYFETHVMDCKETGNNDVMVVTTHVAIPDLVNTHHPGQTVPCIQLLTMELWSDELLISSTAAVFPPAATLETENEATTTLKQCWWWGSRPATVTAAMSDLQLVQNKIWRSTDSESVDSYHELMYDISMFMTCVRDVSTASGFCRMQAGTASIAAARLPHPILNTKQLQQLGSGLIAYTQQAGMRNLTALVKQQMQHVAAPSFVGSISKYVHPRIGQCLERIKTPVTGFSCYGCEQLYKQQLVKHLAQLQAMYSVFVLLSGFAAFMRSVRNNDAGHAFLCTTWMVPSVFVLAHHIRQSGRHASRAAATCSPACMFSLLLTFTNWAYMATGLIKAPSFALSVYQTPLNVPIHLFIAGGEQLPSTAFLPAPVVFAAAVCIAASVIRMHEDHSSGWFIGLIYFLVTVVARLIVDMRLRALLVPCHRNTRR